MALIRDYLSFLRKQRTRKSNSYLQTQIDMMIENHAKTDKRLILTDAQQIRLAAKAKKISRKMLNDTTDFLHQIRFLVGTQL